MEDWLALPSDALAEKTDVVERPSRALVVAKPKKPRTGTGIAAKKGSFAHAWKQLTAEQRTYIEQMMAFKFNKGLALKKCALLLGEEIERHRPLRWRKDPNYARCIDEAQRAVVDEVTSPATMLLQADEILHIALEGKQIYGPGGVPLGVEPQLDTALRANEQKMKATGMLRGEEKSTRVTVRLVNLAGSAGQQILDAQAETESPE